MKKQEVIKIIERHLYRMKRESKDGGKLLFNLAGLYGKVLAEVLGWDK